MTRLARLLGSSERQLPKTVIVWLTSQSWPFGWIPLSDRNAFLNSLYAFLVLNVVYYTFQLSKRPNSFVYLEQHTLSLCCLLNSEFSSFQTRLSDSFLHFTITSWISLTRPRSSLSLCLSFLIVARGVWWFSSSLMYNLNLMFVFLKNACWNKHVSHIWPVKLRAQRKLYPKLEIGEHIISVWPIISTLSISSFLLWHSPSM